MNFKMIVACVSMALSLSFGQLLFKMAADDIKARLDYSYLSALLSPWFFGGIILYAGSTVLWVGVLMHVPLSRAYPFALLGAALVPILAVVVIGESLSPYYPLGMGLVILGIAIIQAT